MKKLFLFAVLAILFSCNKTSVDPITEPNSDVSKVNFNGGGVTQDNPELNKNFPVKVSQQFLEQGRVVAFTKDGKKFADLKISEFNSLQSKGTKGWGQGGNPGSNGGGGGSTSGGSGGTTTQTDWTPPMIAGVSPLNGENYTLSSLNQAVEVYLQGGFYDETRLVRFKLTVNNVVLIDSTGPFLQGYGNYNFINYPYRWPFGDGTYTMSWQAWDAAGNTTLYSSVFSRNTAITVLPANFPTSYTLPWPKVDKYINQGGEGSCASFTVANAYTIQKYVRGGLTGGFNDNNVYSPEWLYNICKVNSGCGSGSGIISNMGVVAKRGVPTWAYLPYSYYNGCDTSIFTDAIRANAALNKGSYGFMTPSADYTAVKYNITQGYVGIFAYQVDHQINYSWPPANFIWTFPHYRDGGPHASVLVGFDDSKHAFLMLNSWSNQWANEGAMWVDYDFFMKEVSGALYYFAN